MQIRKIITKDVMLLLLSSFLFFGTYNLLLPTFPLYVSSIGGNERIVGLLGGLFAFSAVFLRPMFSKIADRRGRKTVLFIAAFTAATGPLFYLPQLGFWYLALARIYHAASLAAFITASQTLLADYSTPENRGTMFGIYGIASGIAMAVTPAIGLSIATNLGYSTLFIVTTVMGLGIIPTSLMVREPLAEKNEGKVVNSVTITELIKNKWVLVSSFALFSVTMTQGAVNAFLPLHSLSVGIMNVGIFFTIYSVSSMIGRIISGPMSDKFGRKTVAIPALISVSVGAILLSQLSGYVTLISGAILIGYGFATTHTVLLAQIIDKTSIRERSQAVSFYANAFDLGVSAGAMGLGALAAYSYSGLWIVLSIVAAAGFILTITVLPRESQSQSLTAKHAKEVS